MNIKLHLEQNHHLFFIEILFNALINHKKFIPKRSTLIGDGRKFVLFAYLIRLITILESNQG